MKPVQAGDTLYCETCGVEVTVTKSCGCDDCHMVCCSKPMKLRGAEEQPASCCCGH